MDEENQQALTPDAGVGVSADPGVDVGDVNEQRLDGDKQYRDTLDKVIAGIHTAQFDEQAKASENPQLRHLREIANNGSKWNPWTWVKKAAGAVGLGSDPLSPEAVLTGQAPLDNADKNAVGRSTPERLLRASERGFHESINEMGRTAMELGAGALKESGLYHLQSQQDQAAFLKWYEQSSRDWSLTDPISGVPLVQSKAQFEQWAGPQQDGVAGFVDDATQFATSAAVASEGLKGLSGVPVVGDAASALNKTRFLRGGLNGVIAQMTGFDPYDSRLSSMLSNGPEWFAKPAVDFIFRPLAPRQEDGAFMARIRAGAEGYLTGQAVEGLLFGLKIARGKFLEKTLGSEAGANYIADTLKMGKEEFPHFFKQVKDTAAPAQVVKTPDGYNQVHLETPAEAPVETAKPAPGPDFKPRALDFKHEAVTSADQIKPTSVTIGLDANGKNVVRAIEEAGDKPKVYEFPLDEKAAEQVKQFRSANPEMSVTTPAQGTYSDAERKLWEDIQFSPKETPPAAAEELTNAEKPSAKAAQLGNEPTVLAQHVNAGKAQTDAASFNMAVKNIQQSGEVFVDEEARKAFGEALQQYGKTGDARSVGELLNAYGFNSGYIQQPQAVINALKSLVDTMPAASMVARDTPRSMAEVSAEAAKLFPELKDQAAVQQAAQMFGGIDKLPEKLLALRAWMWWQAGQIKKLTQLVDAAPENPRIVDQQVAAMNTLFQVHAFATGATTRVAQALQIHQQPLGELVDKLSVARQGTEADFLKPGAQAAQAVSHRAPGTYPLVAGMTRPEIQALGQMIGLADGNLDKMLKLLSGPKVADVAAAGSSVPATIKKSFGQYVNAYRTEALLSSPITQMGLVINNLGVTIKRPLQYFWAGVESNDKGLANEGQDMLAGLVQHWYESASLATKAFKTGRNLFDSSSTVADTQQSMLPLEAKALQWGKGLPGNLMAILAHLPSRLLMTADEFFKQLNGRAFVRAQTLKALREAGVTDTNVLTQKISDSMKVAFDPNGGAIHPGAIEYARDATFTKDLPAKLDQWMKAIGNTETGKFILPFRRTPSNIFLHAWEEAPGLNLLNKQMVEDLNAGGRRGALARAKADTGAVLWGLGAWLALSGKITGAGPVDPELKRQWVAAGNQPYSIRLGNSQFSYRRGDPFTSSLGIMADVIGMSGELDENSKLSTAALGMTALANNVTNKTFMQGLSDFLDALSSGDVKNAQTFFSNAAGSLIPNVLTRSNPDDTVREAQGVMDRIQSRIPGMSASLEPRRNIFGEKVMKAPGWANRALNPFQRMGNPPDFDLQNELLKLGKAMPMPPEQWAQGRIDLKDGKLHSDRNGQSPYDRSLEMMSAPPWGGVPSLRDAVSKITQTNAYKKAKDTNAWGPGGTRYMMVSEIIQAYHQAAKAQLLKEYPSLLQAVKQSSDADAAAIMGGRNAAQEHLQQYQQLFIKH